MKKSKDTPSLLNLSKETDHTLTENSISEKK